MQTPSKELNKVLKEIERITDFDARLYRSSTLRRRIGLRMKLTNSNNYEDYLDCLQKDQSESDKFLEALTINVSDFFRDGWVFRTLESRILPDLIHSLQEKGQKRLRIWSVGCSRGQEPYSLAILLHRVLNGKMDDYKVLIHATDVSRDALTIAKKGIYSEEEVHNVPKKELNRYFSKEGAGYRIKDNLRRLVRFKHHDLIKGDSLGVFHLILCRNLFIFFQPQLQQAMLGKLHASLKKDGILVLGSVESPKGEDLFNALFSQDRIYQKRKGTNSSKQNK